MNTLFLTKVVGAVSAVSFIVLSSCTPAVNPNNPNASVQQQNPANPYAVPGLNQQVPQAPQGPIANAPYQQLPNPQVRPQPQYIPDPAPNAGFKPQVIRPNTGPNVAASTHTVVSGDTLSGLSRKYNVSVSAIMAANGLDSSLIKIGQTLNIPGN